MSVCSSSSLSLIFVSSLVLSLWVYSEIWIRLREFFMEEQVSKAFVTYQGVTKRNIEML